MKRTKFMAGIGAGVLAASSLALGITASPVQAAEGSTSGKLAYTCGLINGVADVLSGDWSYSNVDAKVSVSPNPVNEGNDQTIRVELGGNGTTAVGPSPFDNGPIPASGGFQAVLNVSINGAAPVNILGPMSGPVDGNAAAFPNGIAFEWTNAFPEGVHTVAIEQLVMDSVSSGTGWGATGDPTDVTVANSFDAICNGGTTQMTIVGNNAPTAMTGATAQPASYLGAVSTGFTVNACDPAAAAPTSTKLTASPASPQLQGTSVTLSATVTSKNCDGDVLDPTGTIQFKDGSTNLGSAQAFSGSAVTTSTSSLAVGAHDLKAVFTPTDSSPEGFQSSTGSLSYQITAKSTPAPSPSPSKTDPKTPEVDTGPVSDSATVTAYCDVQNEGLGALKDYKFPIKLTVTPGAAKPGSTVQVKVEVDESPINSGPTVLDPGAYRMEATIGFQGKSVQLTGPTNKGSVAATTGQIFKSNELPTVATGTIDLPNKEGDFEVIVEDIWYNNISGGTGTPALTDIFDNRCNASNTPNASPKAFAAPTVDVTADASAPETEIPNEGGGPESGPALAATGPSSGPVETTVLALIALAVLQLGAILAVRAHRQTPRRIRS